MPVRAPEATRPLCFTVHATDGALPQSPGVPQERWVARSNTTTSPYSLPPSPVALRPSSRTVDGLDPWPIRCFPPRRGTPPRRSLPSPFAMLSSNKRPSLSLPPLPLLRRMTTPVPSPPPGFGHTSPAAFSVLSYGLFFAS